MRRLWILSGIFGLTVIGCGSKFSGNYEGTQPQPTAPENIRASVAVIRLELKSTGRFLYRRMGMPWEGEWRQEDGKIKLTIDEALGKAVAPGSSLTPDKIELTPLEGGAMKLSDTFVSDGETVVLKRIPSSK